MGVQQSCQLDRMSDLCDMHTCIDAIEGRVSDATSRTETWVATLKPGTTYEDVECKQVFMKIGINPSSIPVAKHKNAAIGLMYELQVYNQLLNPILNARICPNFLRSYLVSYNCLHSDLVQALMAGLRIDQSEAARRLDRNLSYVQQGIPNRPAVHEPLDQILDKHLDKRLNKPPSDDARFMVLTTEHTDVQTYGQWLRAPHTVQSLTAVLLQIVVALHTMALSKLMHNDLHGGNVFVQTLDAPRTLVYDIQGLPPVSVTSRYKAMVDNFSQATSQVLGDNAMFLRSQRFKDLPLFEEKRDLVCLYKNLGPLNVQSRIGHFFDMSKVRPTPWDLGRGDETSTTLLMGLKAISAELLPFARNLQPVDAEYTITRDMFMRDGSLNRDHKALTDLRWQNAQYETKIIEFNAYIEQCQDAVRQHKAKFEALRTA